MAQRRGLRSSQTQKRTRTKLTCARLKTFLLSRVDDRGLIEVKAEEAAKALGVSPSTVRRRLKQLYGFEVLNDRGGRVRGLLIAHIKTHRHYLARIELESDCACSQPKEKFKPNSFCSQQKERLSRVYLSIPDIRRAYVRV